MNGTGNQAHYQIHHMEDITMLNLSDTLTAKAVVLHSVTIDSPTERTNDKGEAIRPTIYFDKPVKEGGKLVPGKKSKLYTPNEQEAKALKATCDGCESICLDGAGKYDHENDMHFRFLKSTLTDDDWAEIKSIKGMLSANKATVKVKKALKACLSQYIMGLPLADRNKVANALADLTQPVMDTLRNTADDDEADTPLFS
jgi:hypothetical protein